MSLNHSSALTAAIATIEPSSFCFRPENPIRTSPFGQSGWSPGVDRPDEVFEARADDDDDQVGGQCQVDQAEDIDDDFLGIGTAHLQDEILQLEQEFVKQPRQTGHQAEQERGHQPTAAEQNEFDPAHHARGPKLGMAGILGRLRVVILRLGAHGAPLGAGDSIGESIEGKASVRFINDLAGLDLRVEDR